MANQNSHLKELLNRPTFTCSGQSDGVGSQATSILSAQIYAYNNNFTYVHSPFFKISHNYERSKSWESTWESFLNLGNGYPQISDFSKSKITEIEFSKFKSADQLSTDRIYRFPRLGPLSSKYFDYFHPVLLRHRFNFHSFHHSSSLNPNNFNIAIHIRRGDVSLDKNPKHRNRYTENNLILRTISQLRSLFEGPDTVFHLYSEGTADQFQQFVSTDTILHLDESPFDSLVQMIKSDVFVTAKSSFSRLAAYLKSDTATLIDLRGRKSSLDWIYLDNKGGFSNTNLLLRINRERLRSFSYLKHYADLKSINNYQNLHQRAGIKIERENKSWTQVDRAQNGSTINNSASVIWEMSDGSRSASNIIKELVGFLSNEKYAIKQVVNSIVSKFEAIGYTRRFHLPEAILYEVKQGGLGNRISGLTSCMALSRILQIPMYLNWKPDDAYDAEFLDLFDVPEGVIYIDNLKAFNHPPDTFRVHNQMTNNDFYKQYSDMMPMIGCNSFIHLCAEMSRRLVPTQKIQTRIESYSRNTKNGEATIGIHIRTADHRQVRLVQVDPFEQVIETIVADYPKTNIFLATDNPHTEKRFCKKYNLLTYRKDWCGESLPEFTDNKIRQLNIEDALVDMMVLAQCNAIFALPSSFSRVAAQIGNCPIINMEERGMSRYVKKS